MSDSIDLSHLYNLRNDFIIIGLTGQIGSGCSDIAQQLTRGFRYGDFEDPVEVGIDPETLEFRHDSYRKYRIVYKFAEVNFKSYIRINYKDVLILFLFQNSFDDFIKFLESPKLKEELETIGIYTGFGDELQLLNELKTQFDNLSVKYKSIKIRDIQNNNNWEDLYEFYFDQEVRSFIHNLLTVLKSKSRSSGAR